MPTPTAPKYRFDPIQALHDFQDGPDIPRPNFLEQQIPVVGSAWQAVGDLQDGNYGAAALNGGMAVLEALPVGTAVKGGRAFVRGVDYFAKPTFSAARKELVEAGLVRTGQDVHHVIPVRGAARFRPDWRNNPALLKPLKQAQHRRIHTRWGGEPRYDPVRRAWHGTTEAMKTVPAGLLGYTISSAENATRTNPGHAKTPTTSQPPGRK
jgi:hypothetical protein